MDYDGGFHEVEIDDKLFLEYHRPKYQPISKIKSPSSSTEAANHNQPLLPLFLCPSARVLNDPRNSTSFFPISFPEYVPSITEADNDRRHHHVLPLFWCNNKNFDVNGGCVICYGSNFGKDYYFCDYCDRMYHKECVESPLKIKHPYYPQNSLELYVCFKLCDCLLCGRKARNLVYHCTSYQAFMHPICAMSPVPFVIDQPKSHNHPLTFFPRQTSLICNVCGLLNKKYPTYLCFRCNYVAHKDCMYSPHIIKISRHNHRISYVSSLSNGKWSCGVCRQSIDGYYGAYTCNKCGDYAVHSRCALGKDVCDGEELKGIPEKDDITKDPPPFLMLFGAIHYFLHNHDLRLKENILYDENKLCDACVMPIFECALYSCMECDFLLHETCLKARRRIQHALHPHLLTLGKHYKYRYGAFYCNACWRRCGGFAYQCPKPECNFLLDVRCASISEPFDYQGHEHPLFLSLDPKEKVLCEVCKLKSNKPLNCIQCDFIVCIKCVTLPYKARYKHDEHFLTISWGEETCEKYWCQECEHPVKNLFYRCNDCCTILHTACLLSEDPYIKPGQYVNLSGEVVQVLAKSNISRPICHYCKKPCQGKRFMRDNNRTTCSRRCALSLV